MSREEILAAAKAMTPAQRYDLIEDLRQILDDDELTPEQMAEIDRRIEASKQEEGSSIPVEDVISELRQKLRNMRRRRAS